MNALLDGVQALFGQVFPAVYRDATLHKATFVDDGKGGGSNTFVNAPLKAQVESYSENYRASLGIAESDVRLMILQFGRPLPTPMTKSRLTDSATTSRRWLAPIRPRRIGSFERPALAKIFGVKAHSSRLKRAISAQTRRQIGAAIYAAADLIRTEAALSIVRGAVQGSHIPSRPGEPPNRDTGQLDTSIVTAKTGEMKAEVRSEAPYSAALEFGTSRMAERPFLRPATQKHRGDAVALVRRAINKATRS